MSRLLLALALAVLAGCAATEPAASQPSATEPVQQTGRGEGGPDYVTQGPERLDPQAHGIGEPVAAFPYADVLAGHEETTLPQLLAGAKGLVVVFTSLGCPVCKNYHPSLQALADRCATQGVRFLAVDPAIQDSAEAIRAKAGRMGWSFAVTKDPDYAITDALGALRTTDTFLVGPDGTLRYRGALDDQYGINYRLDAPRARYLLDALAALAAGQVPATPATSAPGCKLSRVRLPE